MVVNIYMDMEKLELQINGHACSAEPGKDLVCCAVSILAESISRYMERKESSGDLEFLINEIQEGRVLIKAEPNKWDMKESKGAFEVVREGFRALANEYPEYITMEEE